MIPVQMMAKCIQMIQSRCSIFRTKVCNQNLFLYSNCKILNMPSKYWVVFVLGGPGAGKGTQCMYVSEKFGYVHLSAGDLLRKEKAKQTDMGNLIEEHITAGTIVPVEITCKLLKNAMDEANQSDSSKINFLIDGFPRNEDNLQGWQREMTGKADVKFVLFFNCDEQICIERCLARGEAGSGRSDDNIESMKKRIVTYKTSTMPIIEYYRKLDLVREVDASKSKEEVFRNVSTLF